MPGDRRVHLLVTAAVSVPLLLLAAVILVSTTLGWRLEIVRSGSMEPTLPVGSLAVVTPVDPASVAPGSSLVFRQQEGGERLVTHRVVRVVERPDGLFFETRGDANPAADPFLVSARDVRGTVALSVPRLGRVTDVLRQPVALALLLGGSTGLLVLDSVLGRRRRGTSPVHPVPDAVPG